MREPTAQEKRQYERFKELLDISHQRYLAAGGDPSSTHSGRTGEDYLTDEERQEALNLGRQLFGVQIVGNEVTCQGRSWQLPNNSPLLS